jgi:hypothetical protein
MAERDGEAGEPVAPLVVRKKTAQQRATSLVRAEVRPKGGGVVIIGGVAFETFLESSAAGAVERIVGILADEIQAAEIQGRLEGMDDAYERAAMLVSVMPTDPGADPMSAAAGAIRELADRDGGRRGD